MEQSAGKVVKIMPSVFEVSKHHFDFIVVIMNQNDYDQNFFTLTIYSERNIHI